MLLLHYALLILCELALAHAASPNFVFILTDDQDLVLKGMEPLEKTADLVANTGKTFKNMFVNSPVCCPSRGTILTGKYAHNNGIVNNSIDGNCASLSWQQAQEPFSIAALLQKQKDYSTFYAGKYLNNYGYERAGGTEHVPQGYDWWIGLRGNSRYYNYTLSVNGTAVSHQDGELDYLTDVLANYSIDFLNSKPGDKPFFMTVATPAAHAPFTPAKRHEASFADTKALRTPAFNYTPTGKHWLVDMAPDHLPENVTILDTVYRNRWGTLLAVDEMVERIVAKLEELKLLENTYIIFASDNGFHVGQFTLPWDKRQPYETDVRVPLIISGPNIPSKSLEDFPVNAIDLAPTIWDLAGVEIPENVDGRSFKDRLFSNATVPYEEYVYVEYWGEGDAKTVESNCPWTDKENLSWCIEDQWCKCQDSRNNTYDCVLRLSDLGFKFCQFRDNKNFIEAYNLTADAYELENLFYKMADYKVEDYLVVLQKFRQCSGPTCRIYPLGESEVMLK